MESHTNPKLEKGPEQNDNSIHENDFSVGESVPIDGEGLKRDFSPRQVHIISLGSNIGSGLFIATGKALHSGGPGSMMIAYALMCTYVAASLQTLSEMTIAFPVSGNFINYADRWLDPSLAFAAGFAEWLGWTAVASAEATVFTIIVNYWANDSVNQAVWLTIFIVFVVGLFMLPNKYFAIFEYWTSLLKLAGLIIIIITSIVILAGGGPTGSVHNGQYWRDLPVFNNGFRGFGNCMLLALWAVGDQVFTGIMGGEAQSPRQSLGHATKLVPYRVTGFYMVCVTLITLLVPLDDPRLFGASGVAASPFVIAMNDAGITGLPDFINVVIMVGITAVAAESIYISSRILRALGDQGLAPKILGTVDSKGRPRWSLGITLAVAVMLTYINCSSTGVTIFTWLSNITSSSFFIVWAVVALTSWRFRAALKAQNDPLFKEIYAYECWAWPGPPLWLFVGCILLLVSCIYIGVLPIGTDAPSAESFFQYMLGFVIVLVFTIAHKLFYRTKFRDASTCDLKTGRRPLAAQEIAQLDAYYSLPAWRRFLTYVQLW